MHKPVRIWSLKLFRAWELCTFLIAGTVALYAGRGELPQLNSTTTGPYQTLGAVFVGGALLWVIWLSQTDMYASRRLIERKSELLQIFVGATCAAGFLSLVGAFFAFPLNEASFLAVFIAVLFVMTALGRFSVRTLQRLARARQRNLRHVAIVGTGSPVRNLAWRIFENTNSGIVVTGVFGTPNDAHGLPDQVPFGGNLDDLTDRMMREPIDEVLVTYSLTEHYEDVVGLIDRCRRIGVPVRMVDECLMPFGMRPKIEYVGGAASLVYEDVPDWGWQGQVKEVFDTVFSFAAILLLIPLFIVVAIAIKIDSPGPIFFVQPRVGSNRVTFPFYKFRTMRKDAAAIQASLEAQNESAGPTFKIAKDPRITRVGAFLRKYSIDELPQFLNVLKGEMSLVGPRPLPLRDVERFDTDWHSRRFSVKPGLTCSWVVAGRSELTFDQWVKMDLAYIDNWSLKRDVSIILNTIPAVFRGSGAY